MRSVSGIRGGRSPVLAAVAAALVLGSCAPPTKIVSQWADPGYDRSGLKNVLVIGLNKDATKRRIWEDAFCAALGKAGVKGTQSYTAFQTVPTDTNVVRDYVKQTGFDGVIVTRKLSVQEVQTYVPPTTTYVSGGYGYGGGYWGASPYWGSYYGGYAPTYATTSPGYIETDRIVTVETAVWHSVENGKLIWSAITETTNPTSAADFASELGYTLIEPMKRDGIIKKR